MRADKASLPSGTHQIYFYCDDIKRTVADLKRRGVEFTTGIADRGWGHATSFRAPGGLEIELYEPKYAKKPRRTRVTLSRGRQNSPRKSRARKP